MTRKKTNNENGVIMMETLIMLPVYLVILAGVFWLGEMCLIRQTLNNAERLRLWESGNRQSKFNQVRDSDLFTAFLENATIGSANRQQLLTNVSGDDKKNYKNNFSETETSNAWGGIRQGFVQLNTRRSVWSWGIVDFFRSNMWSGWGTNAEQSKIASGRDEMFMAARGDNNGNPLESMMLFRKDMETRENLDFNDSTIWHTIFAETWGPTGGEFIKPTISDSSVPVAVSAYGARNSNYRDWSE